MDKIKCLLAVAAVSLAVGCNRSSDSGGTSDSPSTSSGSARSSVSASSPDSKITNQSGDTTAVPPDNTAKNVRDRSDSTLTPGDQSKSEADRETTRRIRRALTSNDQLSTDAKNIKIITVDGKVTLRGPVKTQEEQKKHQQYHPANGRYLRG